MWRRPRGQKIQASSVDDIDWRAARAEGVSNPLQSRLYEARKRPRSLEDVQEAAKQFAIEMAAHTKSSLLGHWKSSAPTKADSLFGDTCVGSLLWGQKPLVPHDFTTYLCPEILRDSLVAYCSGSGSAAMLFVLSFHDRDFPPAQRQ
ncbi:hypothetical protein HPB50_022698 [Hyalomma asiaticum]|uniref:Uncharacterized protein n=1 Tax=Hyalomma asiaticum TaxID=266040 RepID=A0ACB7T0V5_HYAAI|nr:hypothetical protein HPB50_022698 [Hyalomma asiaticum]